MSDSGDNVSLNEGIAMLEEGFIEAITLPGHTLKLDLTLFKDLNGKLRVTLHVPIDLDMLYECYFSEGNDSYRLTEDEVAALLQIDENVKIFKVEEG